MVNNFVLSFDSYGIVCVYYGVFFRFALLWLALFNLCLAFTFTFPMFSVFEYFRERANTKDELSALATQGLSIRGNKKQTPFATHNDMHVIYLVMHIKRVGICRFVAFRSSRSQNTKPIHIPKFLPKKIEFHSIGDIVMKRIVYLLSERSISTIDFFFVFFCFRV